MGGDTSNPHQTTQHSQIEGDTSNPKQVTKHLHMGGDTSNPNQIPNTYRQGETLQTPTPGDRQPNRSLEQIYPTNTD